MAYNSFPFLVQRAPASTPFTFTTIAELDTISLPELSGNEADASVQNSNIDKYVVSILQRRKPVAITVNYLPTDPTQDWLQGLYFSRINNNFDGWKFLHNATGTIWIASGQITALTPKTPFEGKLQLDVTLRLSGPMYLNGLLIQ